MIIDIKEKDTGNLYKEFNVANTKELIPKDRFQSFEE